MVVRSDNVRRGGVHDGGHDDRLVVHQSTEPDPVGAREVWIFEWAWIRRARLIVNIYALQLCDLREASDSATGRARFRPTGRSVTNRLIDC